MDYQASANAGLIKTNLLRVYSCGVFMVLFLTPLSVQADEISSTSTVTITAIVQSPQTSTVTPSPSAGGGGGGSGGNAGVPLTNTDSGVDVALFKGLAYPGSIVTLLKNGVILTETPASPNGTFEIHVRNLNAGTYTFGIRAEDADRLRSTLDLYTVFIANGITTVVDGIFIPPTVTTDKEEVKQGDPIIMTGKSAPNATLTLSVHSSKEIVKKTVSSSAGLWLYKFDSTELELGGHEVKARATTDSDLSLYSETVAFTVGTTNRIRNKATISSANRCDLNGDTRVNLKDFSIMAFWYKRSGFPPKADMNADGKINLVDFSVLAYCWTG